MFTRSAEREVKWSGRLMGNIFEITVVDEDEAHAQSLIGSAVAEIRRIEALLTTFSECSQTAMINLNAGIRPVQVDPEVFALISRARRISEITDGAFDLSYGSVDRSLWNFDRTMQTLPDAETAKKLVRLINYQRIILDPADSSVMLLDAGMRIGFGGIGKGYAAERAREMLRSAGAGSGVVNASGDLATWGTQADGKPWTVGIANPDSAAHPFAWLQINDLAVATSGNYEKFVMIGNKKYSHTINPKTGFPVTGIKSVTIICPNAEIADAMATPVTIMGPRAGIALVNQITGMECIIIDDHNKIFTSTNIKLQ